MMSRGAQAPTGCIADRLQAGCDTGAAGGAGGIGAHGGTHGGTLGRQSRPST